MRAHERWAAFLEQIGDRHDQVCKDAEQGAREALLATDFDPTPIGIAWMAVTDRLKELERRIIDTWHEKVEATFESEGYDQATQIAERRKGEDLAFNLENAREASEMRVFASGARELHARALATQKAKNCPSCGAVLQIPITYNAINVTCAHCRSVVTFEPGTTARMAVAFGSHALAWEAAQPEWLVMRQAERAMRDARSPAPLALLKSYERAQIAYWFKYIGTRSYLEPVLGDVTHEVRSRMEFWYRTMDSEEEWRRAGAPRERF
ncbi:MAG TPA: hypothetical protein VM925_35720 [Labilithrix sp.]|nr:hypothetical protein [Labilithrix sp.]